MKAPFQAWYITASSHSGSTLLDLCLGSHSQIQSLGELMHLHRAYKLRRPCSCGVSILSCPFWTEVKQHLQRRGMALESLNTKAEDLETFKHADLPLLQALRSVTGKSILVDSSKSDKRLRHYLSCCGPEFEIKVLHLLRHPLGIAESHRKKGRSGLRKIRQWRLQQEQIITLFQQFGKDVPFFTLRYEDFSSDPETWLKEISRIIGIPFEPSQLRYYDNVHHIPAGNRLRLSLSDRRPIVPDMAWTKKVGIIDQLYLLWTAGSSLRRFGYTAGLLPKDNWLVSREISEQGVPAFIR